MSTQALETSSAENVSSSQAIESALDLVTNGFNSSYCAWVSTGLNTDNVAGIGALSGPVQGTGTPTQNTDVYIRAIANAATGDLTLSGGVNASRSSGNNFISAPSLAFNTSLGQIGLVFGDDTTQMSGTGIGGNINVFAVDAGGFIPVGLEDIILHTFMPDLQSVRVQNVSSSNINEAFPVIAGYDARGWAIGWSDITLPPPAAGAEIVRARHTVVDAMGAVQSVVHYPKQSVVFGGGGTKTIIYDITARQNDTVTLAYSHWETVWPSGNQATLMT